MPKFLSGDKNFSQEVFSQTKKFTIRITFLDELSYPANVSVVSETKRKGIIFSLFMLLINLNFRERKNISRYGGSKVKEKQLLRKIVFWQLDFSTGES